MVNQSQVAWRDAAEWLGDWHPLAEQLGSADGLLDLASVSLLLELQPVHNLSTLGQFLQRYQTRFLLPIELPAIQLAHGHASRRELRELVALDQDLAVRHNLRGMAE